MCIEHIYLIFSDLTWHHPMGGGVSKNLQTELNYLNLVKILNFFSHLT